MKSKNEVTIIKKRQRATSGLAAGGVLARGTLYRYFASSVPVLTFANPRPTAKPPGVGREQTAKFSGDLTWCTLTTLRNI